MKLGLRNASIILLTGMALLAAGSTLDSARNQLSNFVILTGLVIVFIGTLWLVLTLNQRRKKHKL
ncbi:hypothetical protein FEM33_06400 [Dyadobacter flavalbus]|uniref:Uncharacterized protein n=1 Tax=Dyadobacter flavalbus TaxID=2579942 RepID=A0A5M8QXW3_9BACT|nr:hypothetical protein [Dyadobacter flavalbus]KAA6440231.1 hypothetical protein FEM33_06400 [Dyadobacter flavalbus]